MTDKQYTFDFSNITLRDAMTLTNCDIFTSTEIIEKAYPGLRDLPIAECWLVMQQFMVCLQQHIESLMFANANRLIASALDEEV